MDQPLDAKQSPAGGESHPRPGKAAIAIRAILPLILLGSGVVGYSMLSTEPPAPAPSAREPKPVEVRVTELRREDYPIFVRSQGSIRAHSEVVVTAQVSGRVQGIHPGFEEGAFFKEGEVLLELDPVDFEVAVVSAETQLAKARLDLAQEKSRARQAMLGWEDLGYEEQASDLVLRKPHLQLAELQVRQAEEQSDSAKRNLERSRIRAPFDGRVRTRSVGVGQTIGPSTPLGMVFATDYSEVRLPVATRHLADLFLPEDTSDPAVAIQLGDGLDLTSDLRWDAKILRTEGALDAETLELFAIARIEDPFGLDSEKMPLRVGQPVVADIPGRNLENVFVIPREGVANLSRIRLVDPREMTLQSATITPVWADEERLVFRDPEIEDGMLLVLTRLVHAPDGGKVVILQEDVPLLTDEAAAASATSMAGQGVGRE